MSSYIVSPKADEDLLKIWQYLYVLFVTVYSYMIAYRPQPPVEIVRVLHGSRDLRRVLGT